jgi:hypothetical protein
MPAILESRFPDLIDGARFEKDCRSLERHTRGVEVEKDKRIRPVLAPSTRHQLRRPIPIAHR